MSPVDKWNAQNGETFSNNDLSTEFKSEGKFNCVNRLEQDFRKRAEGNQAVVGVCMSRNLCGYVNIIKLCVA